MSLLLQVLLGANVDGSGLSLHVDGRTSWDTCDNLPMGGVSERDGQRSAASLPVSASYELVRKAPKLSELAVGVRVLYCRVYISARGRTTQ